MPLPCYFIFAGAHIFLLLSVGGLICDFPFAKKVDSTELTGNKM